MLLTPQNPDGGWATYENNRGYGWYECYPSPKPDPNPNPNPGPNQVRDGSRPVGGQYGDIRIDDAYVECSMASLSG